MRWIRNSYLFLSPQRFSAFLSSSSLPLAPLLLFSRSSRSLLISLFNSSPVHLSSDITVASANISSLSRVTQAAHFLPLSLSRSLSLRSFFAPSHRDTFTRDHFFFSLFLSFNFYTLKLAIQLPYVKCMSIIISHLRSTRTEQLSSLSRCLLSLHYSSHCFGLTWKISLKNYARVKCCRQRVAGLISCLVGFHDSPLDRSASMSCQGYRFLFSSPSLTYSIGLLICFATISKISRVPRDWRKENASLVDSSLRRKRHILHVL